MEAQATWCSHSLSYVRLISRITGVNSATQQGKHGMIGGVNEEEGSQSAEQGDQLQPSRIGKSIVELLNSEIHWNFTVGRSIVELPRQRDSLWYSKTGGSTMKLQDTGTPRWADLDSEHCGTQRWADLQWNFKTLWYSKMGRSTSKLQETVVLQDGQIYIEASRHCGTPRRPDLHQSFKTLWYSRTARSTSKHQDTVVLQDREMQFGMSRLMSNKDSVLLYSLIFMKLSYMLYDVFT